MPSTCLLTRKEDCLDSPDKHKRNRFLFFLCGFHFLDDGFADSIYLIIPFIAIELHLSFSQVGILKGIFSGAMSLFQLPMSFLGEKAGELSVIVCGLFGLTFGFLLLSLSFGFFSIVFSLVLAEGAAAGQHPLCSSILSRVFESSGQPAAMGTYNFSGDLGKICIPFLMTIAINLWGWRQAVSLLAIFGGIAVFFVYLGWARKQRIEKPRSCADRKTGQADSRWGINDRKSFSTLLTIGIIDMSVRGTLLTFLPFLLLLKGIPSNKLGYALTLLFAGGASGKYFCGVLAERIGIIPVVIATECLTCAGILALLWASPNILWLIMPFVGIMLNGTSTVLYSMVAKIISPARRSRGYGLYYAVTLSAGGLSPVIYGFITDSLGISFTFICIALMALVTIPLSKYLTGKKGF